MFMKNLNLKSTETLMTLKDRINEELTLRKSPTTGQYRLRLSMDTDDDVEIIYNDKPYCFYGEELHVYTTCETIDDVITILESIIVKSRMKATEFTKEWFKDVINHIKTKSLNNLYELNVNSNQDYSISVDLV